MNSSSNALFSSSVKIYLLVLFMFSFFVSYSYAQENDNELGTTSSIFSLSENNSSVTNSHLVLLNKSDFYLKINKQEDKSSLKYSYRKFYLLSINASERILLTELRQRRTSLT